MHSTKSDKNARVPHHHKQQQQPQQHVLQIIYDVYAKSQNICLKISLPARQLSCLHMHRVSDVITTKSVTNLLQRYISVLPLIRVQHTTIGNFCQCLSLCASQLLTPHRNELQAASGYQQSSTATVSKTKSTLSKQTLINTNMISSSFTPTAHTEIARKRQLTRSPSLILLTLLLLWFSHLIGTSYAAPQSCVLCDISDFKDKASAGTHAYEEYHFEHQVSRTDAIAALKTFNVSSYSEPTGCAISCTDKVMKYCLGQQFINDHCWCELGHTEEGLPFVPHICYVGEKLYQAAVGSCYFYEQVKECCCAPVLAKQWRHISLASTQFNTGSLLLLTTLSVIFNIVRRHANSF